MTISCNSDNDVVYYIYYGTHGDITVSCSRGDHLSSFSRGPDCYLDSFKIMRRHMNTHAELNAGFVFHFKKGLEIEDARRFPGFQLMFRLVSRISGPFLAGSPAR